MVLNCLWRTRTLFGFNSAFSASDERQMIVPCSRESSLLPLFSLLQQQNHPFLMYQFWMEMINDNKFNGYVRFVSSKLQHRNSSMKLFFFCFLFSLFVSCFVWRNLMMRNWMRKTTQSKWATKWLKRRRIFGGPPKRSGKDTQNMWSVMFSENCKKQSEKQLKCLDPQRGTHVFDWSFTALATTFCRETFRLRNRIFV